MNMLCPYDIGRDSWEWEGQESEEWPDLNSPQELGEEALTEWTRNTDETEWPLDEIIVEYYCFLIIIIDGAPQPFPPHLASTKSSLL